MATRPMVGAEGGRRARLRGGALTVACALSIASCLTAPVQVCSTGLVCPSGFICDDANSRCVDRDQLAACAEVDDGDNCEFGGAPGICVSGACTLANCGDGIVVPPEVCDPGDDDPSPCRSDCLSDLSCGNGIVDFEELEDCDCGDSPESANPLCDGELNSASGGTCRTDCTLHCGDGVVSDGELCDTDPPAQTCTDYGFNRGRLSCSSVCTPGFTSCGPIGFRRMLPAQVHTAKSLWGSSEVDVYAVGSGGTSVSHYDGSSWSALQPPSSFLEAVWGVDASNVYFAGRYGQVLHYDGTTFTEISIPSAPTAQLNAIWGSGPDDIYAVGGAGSIVHYDGSGWTVQDSNTTAPLYGIWGSGPSDIWAVGDGVILHCDGDTWTVSETSTPKFWAIDGTGSDDVWAVGDSGLAWHHDGSSWEPIVVDNEGKSVLAVIALAPDLVFFGGQAGTIIHHDGQSFVRVANNATDVHSFWGTDVETIFAGGSGGDLRRFSGSYFSRPSGDANTELMGIHGATRTGIYAVGWADGDVAVIDDDVSLIRRFDGLSWSNDLEGIDTFTHPLLGVWAIDDDRAIAVGEQGVVLERVAGAWELKYQFDDRARLDAVWVAPNDDIYVTKGSGVWRNVASNDSWEDTGLVATAPVDDLWADDNDILHAVAGIGIYALVDGEWTKGEVEQVAPPLSAIWGTSADDLHAVGNNGAVYHFDGTSWIAMASTTSALLLDVTGTGASEAYAVGAGPTLLYYDDEGWTPISGMPSGAGITAAWASTDELFIATAKGHLYRLRRLAPWN